MIITLIGTDKSERTRLSPSLKDISEDTILFIRGKCRKLIKKNTLNICIHSNKHSSIYLFRLNLAFIFNTLLSSRFKKLSRQAQDNTVTEQKGINTKETFYFNLVSKDIRRPATIFPFFHMPYPFWTWDSHGSLQLCVLNLV